MAGQPVKKKRVQSTGFSRADRAQLRSRGMSEAQVSEQLRLFRQGSRWLVLDRPCREGDGVDRVSRSEARGLISLQQEAALEGRFTKFVPASGAGSRMFSFVFDYSTGTAPARRKDIVAEAEKGNAGARQFLALIDGISRLAFYDDLKAVMSQHSIDLRRMLRTGDYREIARFLLSEAGLDYQRKPKALVKFHRYPEGNRTAFEEHLVETAQYCRDRHGAVRLHFTILPEQAGEFGRLVDEVRPALEKKCSCRFLMEFSYQLASSDTVAVDLDNRLFREKDGRLLFRPAGHGALLRNLDGLDAELVYVKNIDNVAPETFMGPALLWKKILGGYLVKQVTLIHSWLRGLHHGPCDGRLLREIALFCRESIGATFPGGFSQRPVAEQKKMLRRALNRPVRVCGVVRNQGEPGGGPFWVRSGDGGSSRQIVESAQVNPYDAGQKKIWESAPFFNPVDLVCSLRDYQGKKFRLAAYADKRSFLIAHKTHEGQELKALEWPGLWNGGMARWLTFFVEVPIETFNPVKSVLDLLRPEHQGGDIGG